ncbi:hypothetical protein [Paraburkholderia sp. RAU2J]|uniref:hypothetical protein n=1 Tax=Paraburkholderia sp. RAU2J TaxID=1938810 RepID=UPI0018F3327E|nr:hypothetical protein [Paraburkholderia sp. RAU2J]
MVSIYVRPPEVDDRVIPGYWEGDFIKGAGNQNTVRRAIYLNALRKRGSPLLKNLEPPG